MSHPEGPGEPPPLWGVLWAKQCRSLFLRRFKSDRASSLGKERVRSDLIRLKNQLQEPDLHRFLHRFQHAPTGMHREMNVNAEMYISLYGATCVFGKITEEGKERERSRDRGNNEENSARGKEDMLAACLIWICSFI